MLKLFHAQPSIQIQDSSHLWRLYGALCSVYILSVLWIFRIDLVHMLGLWWRTESYSHCLLIPFIIAWLIWQRRVGLQKLQPHSAPLYLVPLGAVLILWLIGQSGSMAILRHISLVLLLILSVPLILGTAVARALAFPLFFALFMIPAGEELIPYLQSLTAAFSVWLLEMLRVPAYQDGVMISIPNGNFEVAQACSGIRFLIAMLVFATLVAYLGFQSWRRRLLFVAVALMLALLANGLRAGGTIYLAHLTSAAMARGVDHIIFGWIFFALILLLLLAVSYRFFDRPVDAPSFDPQHLQPRSVAHHKGPMLATVLAAALIMMLAAPFYAQASMGHRATSATAAIIFPPVKGWQKIPWQAGPWWPHYRGAQAENAVTYVHQKSGAQVDIYLAVYDYQREGAELLAFGQGVIPPDSPWSWVRDGAAPPQGRAATIGTGARLRTVWQYYMVNDALVTGRFAIKWESLKAQLLQQNSRAMTLVLAVEAPDLTSATDKELQAFTAAAGPVSAFMHAAVHRPPQR